MIDLDLNHTYLDRESFCCRSTASSRKNRHVVQDTNLPYANLVTQGSLFAKCAGPKAKEDKSE